MNFDKKMQNLPNFCWIFVKCWPIFFKIFPKCSNFHGAFTELSGIWGLMIFRYFKVRWYFDISNNFKLQLRANPYLQPRSGSAVLRSSTSAASICGPRRRRWARSRRAAGRPSGAACAKRGSIGQMQISAELVPIPDASRMRPDASGYVRCVGILNSSKFLTSDVRSPNKISANSGKIPAKFVWNLANLTKIGKK